MFRRIPETLYLKRLEVRDMRGFEEAEMSFLDARGLPRPVTLLLGSNGAGKSTLLRALAIGLCQQKEASSLIGELSGDFIRVGGSGHTRDRAEIVLELMDPEDPETEYRTSTRVERDESGQEILTKLTTPARFPWESIFVCGYGVNRGTGTRAEMAPSSYNRRDSVATLFDDDASLLDPEDTLRTLKLAVDEDGHGAGRFDNVKEHLKTLLGLEPSHDIEVTSRDVRVHGPWGKLPFHALGDGYRGTAGWVLDLFRRAHIAERLESSAGPAGVVLIDEIDEHLHPSWQKGLIPTLRRRFPELQLVGTTHSAMSIVNCSPDELWAASLDGAEASVSPLAAPEGHTADSILRGEWFGLESTLDADSEARLAAYQAAVDRGAPREEIERLRALLRERLGRLVESPLDQLALEIAAEVRQQARDANTPEQRKAAVAAGADLLRQRLQELRSGGVSELPS